MVQGVSVTKTELSCTELCICGGKSGQRYTNADLKIFQYVCVHIKTIPSFLILRILELFAREVYQFLKK